MQKRFFHWKLFQIKFFLRRNGGQARPRLRGPDRARTSIPTKKKFETIFNEKIVFAKSQGILFRIWLIWNSKCLEFSKKSEKFDFIQIGSSFKCDMKMIFGAFNNYDIELLSYKIFCDYLLRTLSQFALQLKKFEKHVKKVKNKITDALNWKFLIPISKGVSTRLSSM